MRRIAATALAILAAAPALGAKPLPSPFWGDPTLQTVSPVRSGSAAAEYCTAFVGDSAPTGLTICGWARYDGPVAPIFVQFMFSNVPARATAEGGAELANLTSSNWWDGDADLPLGDDGTWAETCLPASYDLPPNSTAAMTDQWGHGCFVVNVSTDSPLTLTVGGEELQVPVTNRYVRNVQAASASRAVSVAASDPAAHVRFGVAVNPLVQFVGAQFDSNPIDDAASGSMETVFSGSVGGVISNGWRFVVGRARIDGGTHLAVEARGYSRSARFGCVNAARQALWRPSAAFAKDARARVVLASLSNMTNATVRGYGWRAYGDWIDDALIERMRDQDWAELVRRGLVRPGDEDLGTDAAE